MPVHFVAVVARKVATREPRADRLLCIRRRLGVSDCDVFKVFEARRERLSGDDMMTLLKAPTAQADRRLCVLAHVLGRGAGARQPVCMRSTARTSALGHTFSEPCSGSAPNLVLRRWF
jgi:hypothetical protein